MVAVAMIQQRLIMHVAAAAAAAVHSAALKALGMPVFQLPVQPTDSESEWCSSIEQPLYETVSDAV